MKKWLPVFILFLLVLGGIWFWSLGALPEETETAVTIKDLAGDVTIKEPGQEAFRKAGTGMSLENGSVVRTGAFSSAVIDYYGYAETEMSEQSEMVIDRAEKERDRESPIVQISLSTGRIWSRVVSILDLEGEFTAQTSDVVATVRGTSFDLAVDAGGTTLWVADSVVETSGDGQAFVPEDQMMRFQKGKIIGAMEPLSDQARGAEWFTKNRERDEKFHAELQQALQKQVGGEFLAAPGMFRDITRGSEALRTMFSNETDREKLTTRYLLRRFVLIRNQIAAKKLGSAQKELLKLRQDIQRAKEKSPQNARAAERALRMGVRLFYDIDPTSEAYALKQQIEELLIDMAPTNEQAIMTRLMFVQSRLSEARQALLQRRMEATGQILELARQSHENVVRDMELAELEGTTVEKLKHVMHAIKVRMTHLEEALQEARKTASQQELELFSESTAPTTTESVVMRCTDLYIRAVPPTINLGETSEIQVQAKQANGEIIDVSRDALIVITGGIGSLNGTTVTGENVGSGSVQATYTCGGEAIARQGSITVVSAARIAGLIIRPSAIQINPLQDLLLKADILYSDGQTKEVTANASFINLTPQLGFVAGNRFVAGQGEGAASVEARYTDDAGHTYTATSMITIQTILP